MRAWILLNALSRAVEWTNCSWISAAFFAAGHDGGMEAFAEAGGHLVDLVGAVDLDGLAGGAEGDFAVLAAAQVLLQVGTHLGGYRIVDQIVEQSQKLSAGHFSTPTSLEPFFERK